MGNVPVSITIEASSRKESKAYEAMEKAFDEARRIENEVSEWKPESQTSLLNQNAGKSLVPIGRDLMQILLLAREVSEITDGAFDITFPSPDKKATYRDVIVLPAFSLAYLKNRGVKIAVSGIAKGYIVDRISDVLKKEGFQKFLVNAGDIYASGRWEVGIRDPKDPNRAIRRLSVKNQAVSTSGLYERGAHIIDPKTRRPVLASIKSVTIVAKSSAMADALATGAFVLGKDRIKSLSEKLPEIQILIVE
jgi:thiamine biosynthesis lipoprotein